MPHPNAFFSLEPLNEKAYRVFKDRDNRRHVSTLPNGTPVLDVGHVRSDAKDDVTLATISRNGDIHVDEPTISRNQCAFELVRETGVVMFYDRSHAQSSQVFNDPMNPRAAVPFEHGRVPRRVVVRPGLNTIIGMGGVHRNLVQFRIHWACQPEDVAKKIAARHDDSAWCNPRLARTLDEADTLLASQMETRIHSIGGKKPRMRWMTLEPNALGAGAFATVYKALDLDSGRHMAVKLMEKDTAKGNRWWAAFKREVENLNIIHHAHIVDYIYSQGWDGPESIVEIFLGLQEGSLEALVRDRYSGPGVTAKLIADDVYHHMLQALDYLSTKGLIHRDLKPANILYSTKAPAGTDEKHRFIFRLADFGLSNRQSAAKTECGSGIFKAPDVYGDKPQTPKADVWSLLVTMLWMLDTNEFRQYMVDEGVRSKGEEVQHICALATSSGLPSLRAMARADPERRASAAQLLVRYFNGVGLSTPAGSVPPIEFEDDNGPRQFLASQASPSPVHVKGKAPDRPAAAPFGTYTPNVQLLAVFPGPSAQLPMPDSLLLTRNRMG